MSPFSKITPPQDATIREMAARAASVSEIMAATGLARGVIRRYMVAKGITGRPVGWSPLSHDVRAQAAEMLRQGKTRAEVGRTLGIADATIGAIKAAIGISKARFLYTVSEDTLIRDMAARKATLKEIHAALPARTYASLGAHCILLGLRVTDERAHGPEVVARIRELAALGQTDAKIGAATGISDRQVRKMRKAHGIASTVRERKEAERAAAPTPPPRLRAVYRVAEPPEMPKIVAVFEPRSEEQMVARMLAVMRTGCDMPLWGDDCRPTHEYCGAPVKTVMRGGERVRLSWCAACAAVVATRSGGTGFVMKGWS